jgi:hypothetical protein
MRHGSGVYTLYAQYAAGRGYLFAGVCWPALVDSGNPWRSAGAWAVKSCGEAEEGTERTRGHLVWPIGAHLRLRYDSDTHRLQTWVDGEETRELVLSREAVQGGVEEGFVFCFGGWNVEARIMSEEESECLLRASREGERPLGAESAERHEAPDEG